MTADVIACPNCGSRIPVSKLLTEQIRVDLERSFAERLRSEETKFREEAKRQLDQERSKIEAKAIKAAEAKAKGELQRIQREARDQASLVRKLTGDLEAKDRETEAELKRRLQGQESRWSRTSPSG